MNFYIVGIVSGGFPGVVFFLPFLIVTILSYCFRKFSRHNKIIKAIKEEIKLGICTNCTLLFTYKKNIFLKLQLLKFSSEF